MALAGALSSGCFLLHGAPPSGDAGAPRDAGPGATPDAGVPGCVAFAGVIEGLRCPMGRFAPGDRVEVLVQHSVPGCCAGGTGQVTVLPGDAFWTLSSRWSDVCGCCAECECVGPGEERAVTIGPLVPGPNFVRAGGLECVIEAVAPTSCEAAPASATAARVLFPDQTDDVTLHHVASADCGCTPSLIQRDGDVGLELCDCGSSCDDVLTPFEAHAYGSTQPPGDYVRQLGGTELPLAVRAPEDCYPIEAAGLQVRSLDARARPIGEPITWLGVDGAQLLCCAEPLPAVRSEVAADGTIALTLFSCVRDDCACVPDTGTPFTAWHSLGSLPAGRYTARAGAHEARFSVP